MKKSEASLSPTGDGEGLSEKLRYFAEQHDDKPLLRDALLDGATEIDRLNSRSPMPVWPNSLHELEHTTAADPKGLVMYFNSEKEANDFSIWMARAALIGAGKGERG